MDKQKLRKIQIADQNYLWTVSSEYRHSDCSASLTIYQGDHKKSPLRLFFRESDSLAKRQQSSDSSWLVSNVGQGVLWKAGDGDRAVEVVNLNHPGVVAAITRFALQNGWSPEQMKSPMVIESGFNWLDLIQFPKPKGTYGT